MTVRVTNSIPREKFQVFHDLLCSTGGRYVENPIIGNDTVRVVFEHDGNGCNEFHTAWNRCMADIREVRKDQWWRTAGRRLAKASRNFLDELS